MKLLQENGRRKVTKEDSNWGYFSKFSLDF